MTISSNSTTVTPPGGPISEYFEIRSTPRSGRAVFATRDIDAGTLLYQADDLNLNVLLREYRREVCGQCFGYEYGRDLSIRDQEVGFAFCGDQCRETWRAENGDVGIQAWKAVEKLVKMRSREDAEMMDVDLPRPRPKEIESAWEKVRERAEIIRAARQVDVEQQKSLAEEECNGGGAAPGAKKPGLTKLQRKTIQKAIQDTINPDVMTFCVSATLFGYLHAERIPAVEALAIDHTPYHNDDDLKAFLRSYLHLLAILPAPLLPHCTEERLRLFSTRDSHNSFGIRSLEDDGSEFFGFGCWPSASYFNHSCGHNVDKMRVGRVFEFRAGRDIDEGEELCITYLSGDEKRLSRGKRMKVLKRNWGFDCGCERCEEIV